MKDRTKKPKRKLAKLYAQLHAIEAVRDDILRRIRWQSYLLVLRMESRGEQ